MADEWELVEINERLSRFTVLNKTNERYSHIYVAQIQEVLLKENIAIVTTKGRRMVEVNLDSGLRKFLA